MPVDEECRSRGPSHRLSVKNPNRHGHSLQRFIAERQSSGAPALCILPAGAGESLHCQLPVPMHYEASGTPTMMIEPIVALLADEVAAMRRDGKDCSVAIKGLLSWPERENAHARIRFGEAGIENASACRLAAARA